MNFLASVCVSLGVIAGLAAVALVVLFLVLAWTRRSSLAWINIQFSLVAAAIGSECLSNVYAQQHELQQPQLVARVLVYVSLLTCAILSVPLYKRVRRHPEYDEVEAANKQLEYSQRLFKTFLDETPFATYVANAQDKFVYVNTRMAREQRSTSEQMVNTTFDKWFHPDLAARLSKQNSEVITSGQRQEFVNDIALASGKKTYLSYKFPLPGPDQPLVGIVALEISEELKSKATDSLLARIVELSPDAIYTVDDEHHLTSWNQAAERMFGYKASEIIGQPASILQTSQYAHELPAFINQLARGEVIKDKEVVHISKDGSQKHLSLSATKIKSFLGTAASYAAIARDETEARLAAEQMKALNQALDMRAAALSQANEVLPRARDQALESLALRTAFVASMSHAIRTPLSGILGISEILLDKDLNQESIETMETVRESALALLTIVNEMLDLSKMEEGLALMPSRPFNPATLVNDCVKLVQPGVTNKQVKITSSIDPTVPLQVFGDQSRIRQVLLNLIGNAVKFTAAGTVAVEVKMLSQAQDSVTLEFSVADTGMGIAAEDAALLFTPFSRIETSTKGIKGSGLGLAISKNMVEMMQGSIDFESTTGGGSRFWLVLPLKISAEQQAVSAVGPFATKTNIKDELLSGCRILLVEDSPLISMLTLKQLAKLGISAELATTGQHALDKLKERDFDIILMDVNLPDSNGCEITVQIRKMEAAKQLPRHAIVAVTAGSSSAEREAALTAGMDDFRSKPVTTAQLQETILHWLEARKAWI